MPMPIIYKISKCKCGSKTIDRVIDLNKNFRGSKEGYITFKM